KHNNYATREAIELLIYENNLTQENHNISFIKAILDKSQRNRFFKNILYKNHLLLLRSCIYFFYRYFFLFGFLDGKSGLIYHFLQGFWYRFLVDSKIIEIKYVAFEKKITIQEAITEVTGYKNFTV
ncbi:MAG TPA: glycosyltransferase family 2 protein, partial [Chryseobacterium sp.]|nr:glycosyltransferase family 2 protein [Chryseobacterium sp.]